MQSQRTYSVVKSPQKRNEKNTLINTPHPIKVLRQTIAGNPATIGRSANVKFINKEPLKNPIYMKKNSKSTKNLHS